MDENGAPSFSAPRSPKEGDSIDRDGSVDQMGYKFNVRESEANAGAISLTGGAMRIVEEYDPAIPFFSPFIETQYKSFQREGGFVGASSATPLATPSSILPPVHPPNQSFLQRAPPPPPPTLFRPLHQPLFRPNIYQPFPNGPSLPPPILPPTFRPPTPSQRTPPPPPPLHLNTFFLPPPPANSVMSLLTQRQPPPPPPPQSSAALRQNLANLHTARKKASSQPSKTPPFQPADERYTLEEPVWMTVAGLMTMIHYVPPNPKLPSVSKIIATKKSDAISVHKRFLNSSSPLSTSIYYSDGSCKKNGYAWGAAVKWDIKTRSVGDVRLREELGSGVDPTDAEMAGMRKAVEAFSLGLDVELRAIEGVQNGKLKKKWLSQELVIFCDSQAAITMIDSSTRPQSVLFLSALSRTILTHPNIQIKVSLVWIPAHIGIAGNEIADCTAVRGGTTTFLARRAMTATAGAAAGCGDLPVILMRKNFGSSSASSSGEDKEPVDDAIVTGDGSVFVSSFPERATTNDFEVLFGQFGPIKSVDIFSIPPTFHRFAVVTFFDAPSTPAITATVTAIQCLDNRIISIPPKYAYGKNTEVWNGWQGSLRVTPNEVGRLIPEGVMKNYPSLPGWVKNGYRTFPPLEVAPKSRTGSPQPSTISPALPLSSTSVLAVSAPTIAPFSNTFPMSIPKHNFSLARAPIITTERNPAQLPSNLNAKRERSQSRSPSPTRGRSSQKSRYDDPLHKKSIETRPPPTALATEQHSSRRQTCNGKSRSRSRSPPPPRFVCYNNPAPLQLPDSCPPPNNGSQLRKLALPGVEPRSLPGGTSVPQQPTAPPKDSHQNSILIESPEPLLTERRSRLNTPSAVSMYNEVIPLFQNAPKKSAATVHLLEISQNKGTTDQSVDPTQLESIEIDSIDAMLRSPLPRPLPQLSADRSVVDVLRSQIALFDDRNARLDAIFLDPNNWSLAISHLSLAMLHEQEALDNACRARAAVEANVVDAREKLEKRGVGEEERGEFLREVKKMLDSDLPNESLTASTLQSELSHRESAYNCRLTYLPTVTAAVYSNFDNVFVVVHNSLFEQRSFVGEAEKNYRVLTAIEKARQNGWSGRRSRGEKIAVVFDLMSGP